MRKTALPLLLSLAALACSREPAVPRISLGEVEPSVAPGWAAAEPLRIAISPMESPQLSLEHYAELFNLVGRRTSVPVEIIQRETYSDTISFLEHRRADVALVCSGPYLEASQDFGAEILAVPKINGKAAYHAYVIVHRDSAYQAFDELRGTSFGLTDPLSTSGMIFPAYLLRGLGHTTRTFFSRVIFTKGHDNSIRAVADRLVDGASVSALVYADIARTEPKVAERVRVIVRSPPFGNPPLIVHPSLNAALKTKIRKILLSLHEDDEGRRLLLRMGVDRFVVGDPRAYDGAKEMRRRVLHRERS